MADDELITVWSGSLQRAGLAGSLSGYDAVETVFSRFVWADQQGLNSPNQEQKLMAKTTKPQPPVVPTTGLGTLLGIKPPKK